MTFLFSLIFLAIIFVCMAMLIGDGLWSNLIAFVNVLFAAPLATTLFEPAAAWLDSMAPSFTYLIDILALWGIFAMAMIVLRLATNTVSRVRVRFHYLIDRIGGIVMALWTSWILVGFAMMTLHTAPLARNFMGGVFYASPEPVESQMFLGLAAPDRQWLAFVHMVSKPKWLGHGGGDPNTPTFDPQGEFIIKYAARRSAFETEPSVRVQRD